MKALNPKAEYIIKNGKPTAVIMPIAEYEEMLEANKNAIQRQWNFRVSRIDNLEQRPVIFFQNAPFHADVV